MRNKSKEQLEKLHCKHFSRKNRQKSNVETPKKIEK